jgi:hypothetical protein
MLASAPGIALGADVLAEFKYNELVLLLDAVVNTAYFLYVARPPVVFDIV